MKKILLLAAAIFCFLNFTNAQAGRLDTSFGLNGVVTADLGEEYNYPASKVNHLLLQSDGSIIFTDQDGRHLSKRRSDGSRDISYGINGYSLYPGFYLQGAAIQPDERL
jgi:hypothetical protein